MKIEHLLVLAMFALLALGAFYGSDMDSCKQYAVTDTASDYHIETSGKTLRVTFEPDTSGSGTGTQVTVYGGGAEDTDRLDLYYMDTNWDGVPDSAVLTGVGWPINGRYQEITVAGIVKFDTTAYVDDGMLTVCGAR